MLTPPIVRKRLIGTIVTESTTQYSILILAIACPLFVLPNSPNVSEVREKEADGSLWIIKAKLLIDVDEIVETTDTGNIGPENAVWLIVVSRTDAPYNCTLDPAKYAANGDDDATDQPKSCNTQGGNVKNTSVDALANIPRRSVTLAESKSNVLVHDITPEVSFEVMTKAYDPDVRGGHNAPIISNTIKCG
jgi:hypothetical protein